MYGPAPPTIQPQVADNRLGGLTAKRPTTLYAIDQVAEPKKNHVLLVEDDPSISQLYAFGLRMSGYRVDIAADAATAQVMFACSRPDVVCVDSRLPDGSGSTLASVLVGRGATVILLTNDQECWERPPAGIDRALLKWRTTPAQLSEEIGRLSPARARRD